MKLVISLVLVALSTLMPTDTPSETTTISLLDAAIHQYLETMKAEYQWAPKQFIIETEDLATYNQLRLRHGETQIFIKTAQEIREYSTQHVGRTVPFFNFDVEQAEEAYRVYVVTESIRTTMQEGAPAHDYGQSQQGRACALQFDAQLSYQGIDCLLQPQEEAAQ